MYYVTKSSFRNEKPCQNKLILPRWETIQKLTFPKNQKNLQAKEIEES